MPVVGACGLGILLTLSIGVAVCCSPSTFAQASAIVRLADMRLTSGTPKMAADPAIPADHTPTSGQPTPAAATVAPTHSAAVSRTTGAAPTTPGTTHPAPVGAAPTPHPAADPSAGSIPAAVATVPVRRTPSAAEVNNAIQAVHQLVPFFTPTAKQVARVGNQVCTALDQGMTFAQVKSKISAMLGSLSWLLPSSIAGQGVRTTVNLYCPGYADKLA